MSDTALPNAASPLPEALPLARELYGLLRELDRPPAAPDRPRFAERARQLSERLRAFAAGSAGAHASGRLAELAARLQAHVAQLARDAGGSAAFSAFRSRAAPLYEDFAATLRAADVPAPTLRPQNHARSVMHVTSGFIGVACVELLPWAGVIGVASAFVLVAAVLEVMRRRSEAWSRFSMAIFGKVAHPHEVHRVNSATWYAIALLILSLTCGAAACAAACIVLGLGDPAAAYVGRNFGRIRLRSGRSLEGTLAFAVAGTLAALAVFAVFHASGGLGAWPVVAVVAGVSGALAELFTGRVDDNFSIPLVVGAAVSGALALVG
jgi:dolichol kinase